MVRTLPFHGSNTGSNPVRVTISIRHLRQAKGRIFISKAVILLSAAKKNRDANHLRNFVHDQCAGLDADKLAADLQKAGREKIPYYAFDCHTQKGRKMGKSKAEFFRAEQAAKCRCFMLTHSASALPPFRVAGNRPDPT